MKTTVKTPPASSHSADHEKAYVRFTMPVRIEHLVFLISFSLLGITGLPQKYPTSPISQATLGFFGGIDGARIIHHISAVVMLVVSAYHILALLYRVIVLRSPWSMMPVIDDFKHFITDVLYYLGFRKHKGYYGRYNYAEKVEYLAVVWGTIVMAITGFMMWNPIATTTILPGEAIPAAKAAHGGEAVLAVVAILIWHFYHVHLKVFNKSMFNGKLTHEEMEEEHPAELARIASGKAWKRPAAPVLKQRQRFYFPVAALLLGFFGSGLVWFVTLENTAPITTVPRPEMVEVYVPLTPTPRPTPVPSPTPERVAGVAEESWEGKYSALFRNRCSTCHGVTAVGGLSMATYQDTLKGGNSGPGIVPGDSDASMVVQIQASGSHPGQLTIDELNQVIEWIKAGAAEK